MGSGRGPGRTGRECRCGGREAAWEGGGGEESGGGSGEVVKGFFFWKFE